MKFDIGKILGITSLVKELVAGVQRAFKRKPGQSKEEARAEKKAAVIEAAKRLLPLAETIAEKDLLNDEQFNTALSQLVDMEKALLNLTVEVKSLRAKLKDMVVAAQTAVAE